MHWNLEEKEQLKQELEREQRRNERALDKKEKSIEEKQIKVNNLGVTSFVVILPSSVLGTYLICIWS